MTSEWCKEVGLSLNPSKIVIVPFTDRYKLQRMKAITLSQCGIKASNDKNSWTSLGKVHPILSDSQAAIKALSKAKITSKLVNEVRIALDKLGAVNKLTIR